MLKRSLAPVSEEAWDLINEEAQKMFGTLLSGRRVVEVSGPFGWDYAGVPTGRLEFPGKSKQQKLKYGLRQVKPLVEVRIPFELDIWELDNVARGAEDIDLDAMTKAAKELAAFEDGVLFNGLKEAQIKGINESSGYEPIAYPKNEEDLPKLIAHGFNMLQGGSAEGPYTLFLGAEKWQNLTTCSQGYPLRQRIEEILEGRIVVSQHLKGGFLVPENKNDLKLTLGNDISIGYESHNEETVKLYFTESFTFQVLNPAVIVILK